jgi:rubredoxin
MTHKFIRWNCPNCETHNILPVAPEAEPPALRCAYCEYLYDPLDDTHPRAEGWAEERAEERTDVTPLRPPRPRWRETPS